MCAMWDNMILVTSMVSAIGYQIMVVSHGPLEKTKGWVDTASNRSDRNHNTQDMIHFIIQINHVQLTMLFRYRRHRDVNNVYTISCQHRYHLCTIPYEKKLYGTYMPKLYVKYRGHIIVKYMSHICILNVNEVEDI